jgi:hypothetical protein
MNRPTKLVIGFCVSIFLSTGSVFAAEGDGEQVPSFKGKLVYIVYISLESPSKSTAALLENFEIRRLGDRFFAVGGYMTREESEAEKSYHAKRVWIPLSEVRQLSEFDSVDEAKKFFEIVRPAGQKE